jgi:hypothetical protein
LLVSGVADFEYNGWNTSKPGFDTYVDAVAKPFSLDIKRLEAIRDKHQPKPEADASAKKATKKGKAAA